MNDFAAGLDPYEDLPEEPEEAFLKLEAHFRGVCARRLEAATQDDRVEVFYLDYIVQVEAAIEALGLAGEFKTEVPSIENVSFNSYLDFNKDVTHYITMLRIRRSQRAQGYSVRFDDSAKRKIHHHLDQVLDIFGKLEVEDRKREKLISRLNELQSEVNQPRTRFDRFAALSMEVSGVVGDAAERSRSSRFWTQLGAYSGARRPRDRSSCRPQKGRKQSSRRSPGSNRRSQISTTTSPSDYLRGGTALPIRLASSTWPKIGAHTPSSTSKAILSSASLGL